ncbi:eCIS core domain-containing protein, partial [Limnofasciculus baicalensis]
EPLQAKLESGAIQRDEMPPEEEEEPLQAKLESGAIQRDEMPPEEEEEPLQAKLMVQRKSGVGGTAATPDLENSIESARGGGQSLSENIREPMEEAFGADFSGVKVHTDGQSDQLNQSIQARAFTTGQDIFFRQGQYDPGSQGGQELLAHELTHVVQQNGGAVQPKLTKPIQTKLNSHPKDPSEDETDAVANQVETVPVSQSSTTDIHGDWLTDAVSAVGDAASAIGNVVKVLITKAELQEIFAKGAAMTPEEAAQAKKLLFQLKGDDFREILKEAIKSGAFLEMLSKLDFWEILNTVANLSEEVVVPTTLLKPATNTIEDDFKRANEIYNPHGIEIEKGNHVDISEMTTKTLLGGDTELDEFTTNQATAEELKLMEENRTKGRITGYWVPSMPSSRGEALTKDHLTNMLDDRTSVVVNTQDRAQDTFAHELGHTLGLPHEDTDANNLMASGSTRNITGPGIDKLSDNQLDIIRKSLFMELGKKGVGE